MLKNVKELRSAGQSLQKWVIFDVIQRYYQKSGYKENDARIKKNI